MNKLKFYNDTKRDVSVHPATVIQGVECDDSVIKPNEIREFILPEGTYGMIKMWDYGAKSGLQIFVSAVRE